MPLPIYVVNFDELTDLLDTKIESEFNTSAIEDILNEYFPQILDILEKIRQQNDIKGIQKIKGFVTKGDAIKFRAEEDILITGITFSQSDFDLGCLDKWHIYMTLKGVQDEDNINTVIFNILEDVYSKDALQHKYFEKFYPVPKGYTVVMEPYNNKGDKTFWVDLEYLEITASDDNIV